jgi:hypothetical protein
MRYHVSCRARCNLPHTMPKRYQTVLKIGCSRAVSRPAYQGMQYCCSLVLVSFGYFRDILNLQFEFRVGLGGEQA